MQLNNKVNLYHSKQSELFVRSDTTCAATCPSRRCRSTWRHV